jgi:8-oxo-dGTP pyrophosphatase MutT (NUDIX family)
VIWAPPGGGLEPGETAVDAVVRELLEEVGYQAKVDEVRHVWHQEVVSPAYAKGWDGAIHDYFLVRCETFEAQGDSAAGDLLAGEGITEFKWWTLQEMIDWEGPEGFRPRNLPALLRDLLSDRTDTDLVEI